MNGKSLFLVGALALLAAGCGGGSSTPPPPPTITVSFSPAAPATVAIGASASVTAVVSNDSANKGVTWSCTPVNLCGAFSSTATGSGVATTYTAPASVPAGANVVVTATSASDLTKTANANVYISGIAVNIITGPTVVTQGTTADFEALVTNDGANAGVNWSCTPAGAANCGTFAPVACQNVTPGHACATYTPPTKSANVTIIATSVTDGKAFDSLPVQVPGAASNATLKGQYAFLIRAQVGNQISRKTTTFAGSVNLDGLGNVLGGMEDIISPIYYDQADPICPTLTAGPCGAPTPLSSYAIDSNGHGILTIRTLMGETLVMSLVVTSASHAEIIETAGNPGSGTLDLQTPTTTGFALSQISGSYAFTLDGVDHTLNPSHRISFGGVFHSDGAGAISGDTFDSNDNGVMTTVTPGIQGTVVFSPDATNGRGRLNLAGTGKTFGFYVVNSKVLRLFEDDGADDMGGSAYSQGTGTPAISGSFVYQHSGWSSGGAARTVAAGQFTTGGTGTITGGLSDSNAGGAAPTTANQAVAVSGSYSPTASPAILTLTDASGAAVFNVYPVDSALNILDPNSTTGGGGALLLQTGASIIGSGVLLPQSSSASTLISGSNALNLENAMQTGAPRELALVGVFFSDGVGNFTNGIADYDADDAVSGPASVMLQAPFTGAATPDGVIPGRYTANLSIPLPTLANPYTFILPSPNPIFHVALYQANSAQALVVQNDTLANSIGRIVQQQLP